MARIRFILVGRLARLHDAAGRPDLDLHVQRHVRDHPPGRHPRRGAAGMGRIPAPRWPPVPCAHRRPAAARRPAEPAHGGTRPCSRGPGPVCDGRGLRRVRPWPALGPERGRSHRCRRHRRSVCGAKPYPDLSVTTPYGAWAATLASSLFAALALACSIPMRAPDPIQAPGESRSARPDLSPGQGAAGADRALPSGRVQL